jgi:hypothetical protein
MFSKGAIMKGKFRTMKSILAAAALVAGVSGIARADDNSMNPYTGDSYAFFNHGNLPQGGKPVIDKAPSAFHREFPHGLPFSTYQALSDPSAPEWQPPPVIDRRPSAFHKEFPHGLPFSTYEAMSSNVWPAPIEWAKPAVASTNASVVAHSAVK